MRKQRVNAVVSPLETPPKAGGSSAEISANVQDRYSLRDIEIPIPCPGRVTGESHGAAEGPLQHPSLLPPAPLAHRGSCGGEGLGRQEWGCAEEG